MSERLPILEIIPELRKTLSSHNTIVLQAPPGSGKSTVLPLEILNESWLAGKKILMLEPRRLATRAVASRMASLLNENAGETVGYRVRFENKISAKTRIEVITEGILTRMLQQDNSLEGIGLVIFDEFHERSLHADLALALCKEAQQVLREDLKLLIMSATLDGEELSSLLGNAPVLKNFGRQHPIIFHYAAQEKDFSIPVQTAKVIQKAFANHKGDMLVFLPGEGEIQRTAEILEREMLGVNIHMLFGNLSQQKQQEAITPDPHGLRKIVLATSIAETSLTIEGIQIVVDSGYSRVPRFDPRTGLTRLETIRVTKDAADQRAGRAGRLGPGTCYRMWSEGTHQHLAAHRTPEILEADLAPLALELAQWGIKDIKKLTWLTPPPAGAVSQAKELLQQLDALEEDRITSRGKEMLRLPTHPRIAHLLLEGSKISLIALATDLAAILEERDPLQKEAGANLFLRMDALRRWRKRQNSNADNRVLERVERLASSWRKIFKIEADNSIPSQEQIGKLLAAAYPERIAKQLDNDQQYFRLANGRIVKLQEHDPLIGESWLSVAHLDAGSSEGKIFLAAPLHKEDIIHLAAKKEVVKWDNQKGEIIARTELRIGEIIVETTSLKNVSPESKVKILCEAIRSEGISLLPWDDHARDWQNRLMSLKAWRPEESWPDVSDHALLSSLEDWLAPYLENIRKREDFKKLDLNIILNTLLPWDLQQKFMQLVPEKMEVPTGSQIRLEYQSDGRPPVLAVRLQEVFGLMNTPTINEGRTKVLMHLLSPGYKPVQVTQDLQSFWKTTYSEVRKELRVRYPKHHWPEDPWTAEAVRGVKRKNPK